MIETERKAAALADAAGTYKKALCRAIEAHEAFRQEVSDAAVEYNEHGAQSGWLGFDHFIIKPVDRKLLCAQAALTGALIELDASHFPKKECMWDYCVRAIELWEEGFGQ